MHITFHNHSIKIKYRYMCMMLYPSTDSYKPKRYHWTIKRPTPLSPPLKSQDTRCIGKTPK